MKANLIILLSIIFITSCSKNEDATPTPTKPVVVNPEKKPSDYFVQVTAVRPQSQFNNIPYFEYVTDTIYRHGNKTPESFPAPKTPVYGFKDSIELYVIGSMNSPLALNIYYKDSLLATDTVTQVTAPNKRLKWRL